MRELLLVDNDHEILELLNLGLKSMGYSVRTATSGLAALRAMEEKLPDALITDLVMPNIGGEKLLKIVQAVPEWQSLKTIVISGIAAEAPEVRHRIPCDVYIAKGPIAKTLQHLKQSIELLERGLTVDPDTVLGIDEIFSRHITRELVEFKAEVDSIVNQITDGICRLDGTATIVWVNSAFSRLFSEKEEKILGRTITPFIKPKDRGLFLDFLTDSAATPIEIELDLPGTRRILRTTRLVSPAESDPVRTILWQDVTRQLLSEEQYENIVESTSDLILTTDLKGRISYASRSSFRVAGHSPEKLVGSSMWDLAPPPESQRIQRRFTGMVKQFLSDSTQDNDFWEMPLLAAAGEDRLAEVRCSPLRNKADRIMGTRLAITDITERRHLEDERKALLHEVQHRVRDNLQLVASLVRLSGPDHLDTRITAVSEVFDELYREQSFSRIHARPLLERIGALAVGDAPCFRGVPTDYQIDAEHLSMRTAVPLSLIVVEAVREMGERIITSTSLTVTLSDRAGELELSLSCTGLSGAGADAEPAAVPDAVPEGIIALLANQLNGECRISAGRSSLRYTLTFVPDRPVPRP